MRKRYKSGLIVSALVTTALLVGTQAFAAHPGAADGGFDTLVLKAAGGADITDGTTPYSPRETCGSCHDYGSGNKTVHKTQGVIEGTDDTVYWQAYDVTAYAHGAVVGRHSQQGRNEDYGNTMRAAFGDPFFTSSPGMFGKF